MLLTLPVARAAGVSPRMPHLFLSFAGCHMQDHPRSQSPPQHCKHSALARSSRQLVQMLGRNVLQSGQEKWYSDLQELGVLGQTNGTIRK